MPSYRSDNRRVKGSRVFAVIEWDATALHAALDCRYPDYLGTKDFVFDSEL
jgi:hypothetical protein